MEENKELIFQVMVSFPELLEREIASYNQFYKTNFEIIETIEEIEVFFCKIKVTHYKTENIFGLGYCLAVLENKLKEKGEIDW